MARRDFDRAQKELNRLEHELAQRLCAELRQICDGYNTGFFFTPEYNPHNFPDHFLSTTSEELLKIARETIKLRRLLVMPTDRCVGNFFEEACIESADLDNPHRLGPIRLAARLLSQISELSRTWT